jgi:glycosyltransferase involved in cell wall biosynthesis
MDSFDKKLFSRDILSYSKNSMMFFWDFKGIHLAYKPGHVKWFPTTIKFPFPKNHNFKNLLLPFTWVIFFGTFLFFAVIICIIYRPKVCLTENTWVASIFGIARKIGLCKVFIYCTCDWLANQGDKGFLSRLVNNYLFIFMDYIAIKTCDLADSYSKLVNEARELHWGRTLAKKTHTRYPPPVDIYSGTLSLKRTNICFLGQVREESGLDLILPLLPELYKNFGAKLKIIGPYSTVERTSIEKKVKNLGLESFVELHGFLPLDELQEAMKDCFCGINLTTSSQSYSSYAVPGKFIQYLQMKIPILASQNNGIVDIIKENNLGVIIEPSPRLILTSVGTLYKDQKKYIKSILKYAREHPYLSIKDYLKMIDGSGGIE